MIEVLIEKGGVRKAVKHEKGIRIFDVLDMLGINPESVVSLKNGDVVLEDEPLSRGDRLELRAVKIPG
jgi:sulfur carrier protein ThiS